MWCSWDFKHLVYKVHKLTDTDKADDLDLLQKLCSSVYSLNLNNSKYMGGIVTYLQYALCLYSVFADAHSLV